jgi:hypothetical protein
LSTAFDYRAGMAQHAVGHQLVDRIVFHQQDAPRRGAGRRFGIGGAGAAGVARGALLPVAAFRQAGAVTV